MSNLGGCWFCCVFVCGCALRSYSDADRVFAELRERGIGPDDTLHVKMLCKCVGSRWQSGVVYRQIGPR